MIDSSEVTNCGVRVTTIILEEIKMVSFAFAAPVGHHQSILEDKLRRMQNFC